MAVGAVATSDFTAAVSNFMKTMDTGIATTPNSAATMSNLVRFLSNFVAEAVNRAMVVAACRQTAALQTTPKKHAAI